MINSQISRIRSFFFLYINYRLPFTGDSELLNLTFGFLCLWLQDWPSLSSSGEERRVEERRAEERGERERERGTCSFSSTEQVEKATGLI